MNKTLKSFLQSILIPLAFLLAVWACLERAVDSSLILPGPAAVLQRAWQLIFTASFRSQLTATLWRVIAAFCISVLISVILGSLQAFVPSVELFFRIPMAFVKAAPVVSFILIALFWFTTGNVPIFVAVLMTMPVVTAAVHKGLVTTDPKLLEMCRVYRFSRAQTFRWCYIPSALPVFSAGAVTAFAQTWKVVVAAEVISLPQKSLGTAMQTAKVHLETTDVFAITLVLVTVSFIMESVFRLLIERLPVAGLSFRTRSGISSEMLNKVQHDEGQLPHEVTVHNFTSVRGGRTVYRNFSHTFASGSVTALVAPSGAGKTTLLDHIAATEQNVSYIFQEPRLLPTLSVLQNVAAPLYRTLGKPAATVRAVQLLSQVGLSHKAASRVTELSGGEKQRVALARAFAFPAPILLMDEAFQSQDIQLRMQLLELFETLRATTPRTVIMATHDIKESLTIADTILVLRNDGNTGISSPVLSIAVNPDRTENSCSRYLAGNPALESRILHALIQVPGSIFQK